MKLIRTRLLNFKSQSVTKLRLSSAEIREFSLHYTLYLLLKQLHIKVSIFCKVFRDQLFLTKPTVVILDR